MKSRGVNTMTRKPVEEWDSLRLGIAGVAALVVGVLAIVGVSSLEPGRIDIVAEFAQAAEIRVGDQVTVAGVAVGEVAGAELAGDRVNVTMKIDRDVALGAGTRASIKLTTLLGSRYVALTPAGSGTLDDGRIPLSHTEVPYDLQETIEGATGTFEQVDAAEVADAMTTLTHQLEGAPEVVPQALANAGTLAEIVAARRTQIGDLISGTERITSVIRTQQSNIGSLMVQGRDLMSELDRRRESVVGMFVATTTLVDELHRTVVGDSPEIQELITELDSMLGSLARHDDLLRNILEVAPLPVRNFTNASGSGNYVDFTGPAGVLVDSWMCALSGRAEEIAANPYFQECR